eukprot:CAMPEP_0198198874 /NCGR_PEP_ID=MMETSP1445-20131203/2239_1 /TAXON_ID=36898 /ORGANISM="Pyramimonas sp., Strain CCMP2087" /LENGTH=1186 /DNA_ID=CAMNT_0043868539 /DNA_START=206 /DNA_END=3766 /DNA_ORIENTATION=+
MSPTAAELTIKAKQKIAERKKLNAEKNAEKESSDTIERIGLVCPMEFPELFFAACSFAMAPPETAHGVSDDTRLLLYALYQQAVEGDCNTTKPWGWNRFEALKWNAWSELDGLASMDAMMMYVHTLEEDNQGWWYLLTSGGDKKTVKDVCLKATMTALEVLGGTEALAQALDEEQKHQLDLDIMGKTIDEVEASKDYQQIIKQKEHKQKLYEYQVELQKEMDKAAEVKEEVEGVELGDELENLKLAVSVASQAVDEKKDSTDAILAVQSAQKTLEAAMQAAQRVGNNDYKTVERGDKIALSIAAISASRKEEVVRDTSVVDLLRKEKLKAVEEKEVLKLQMQEKESAMQVVLGTPVFAKVGQVKPDEWVELSVKASASTPLPRCKQGSVFVHEKMYVIGGIYGGRSLNDVQVLDLRLLQWSRCTLKSGTAPAISGHKCVEYEGDILIVGGNVRGADEMDLTTYTFDLKAMTIATFPVRGTPPYKRVGHSVNVVGDNLYLFGGEPLTSGSPSANDLFVLDLKTHVWSTPRTTRSVPSARSGHCTTVWKNELFVFGGANSDARSTGQALNDLHALDLNTMEWRKCNFEGEWPSRRSGAGSCMLSIPCAGTTIGVWVIAGGMENETPLDDTQLIYFDPFVDEVSSAKLDGGQMVQGGEGITLCCDEASTGVLAYGGYSGKYHKGVGLLTVGEITKNPPAVRPQLDAHDVKSQLTMQSAFEDVMDGGQKEVKKEVKGSASMVLWAKEGKEEITVEEYTFRDHFAKSKEVELARVTASALQEAVREAAVAAAKEGARVAARQAKGPGHSAAAAVSAAVDAAAETAYKTVLTLFTNAAVKEHAARVKAQRLLEKVAEQEQRNSTQDDVIFKMKDNLKQVEKRHEGVLAHQRSQMEEELSSITKRLQLDIRNIKAEHATNFAATDTESTRMHKLAAERDSMQVSEIKVLKLENSKLQKALAGMMELEARVARLMDQQEGGGGGEAAPYSSEKQYTGAKWPSFSESTAKSTEARAKTETKVEKPTEKAPEKEDWRKETTLKPDTSATASKDASKDTSMDASKTSATASLEQRKSILDSSDDEEASPIKKKKNFMDELQDTVMTTHLGEIAEEAATGQDMESRWKSHQEVFERMISGKEAEGATDDTKKNDANKEHDYAPVSDRLIKMNDERENALLDRLMSKNRESKQERFSFN